MEFFEDAQRLFKDYQEKGDLNKLMASLEILDEIIERQNIDLEKTKFLLTRVKGRASCNLSRKL